MSQRSSFDEVAIDSLGNILSGIICTVYNGGTVFPASIYTQKQGGSTKTNPIVTTTNGLIQFWAEPGSYDILVHDPTIPPRFSDRTIGFESVSGDETGGIDGPQLEDSAVTSTKLADGAVTASKFPDGVVSTIKLADAAVTTIKIADSNITAAKLATDSVTTPKIADANVTNSKLATDSVSTVKIQDGAVTSSKLESSLSAGSIPSGVILITGTSIAGAGYLMCDGSAVSRTTYPALFAAIGVTYGIGNATSTFNIPDLRGRVVVGVDGAAARLGANDSLGNSGGTETHTHAHSLSAGSHSHSITGNVPIAGCGYVQYGSSTGDYNVATDSHGHSTISGSTSSVAASISGAITAANGMPPYQVVNYMIKT